MGASSFALQEPLWLWLALALIALLMLCAAVWRPRRAPVASLALWDAAVAASLANRLLPLLRSLRALLTAVAVLLAGVLCGGPLERTPGGVRWALILDVSPSMEALEGEGRTRLKWAAEAASRWLDGLPSADRVGLLETGAPPRWRVLPSASRDAVQAALGQVQSAAPSADLESAVAIAREADLIPAVFSDGAGSRAEVEIAEPGLRFGVGSRRRNRAFVDFELRAAWPAPPVIAWREALFEQAPSSALELVDPLGRRTRAEAIEADAGWREIELPSWTRGIWKLRAAETDALLWDDEVRFRLEGLSTFGLALRHAGEGEGHPALGVAVALAARSFEAPVRILEGDATPAADEVLVQEGGRMRVEDIPAAGALLFGTVLEGLALDESANGGGAQPLTHAVVSVRSDHPALRGLALDRLRVRRSAWTPTQDAEVETLVAGPGAPLLYEARVEEKRIFGTTFLLGESNLAAEGSFPVLLHRMLLELAAPERGALTLMRAGVREGPWLRTPTDTYAGGGLLAPWPAPPSGAPRVFEREGTWSDGDREWPVELLDEEASRIAPGWSPGWSGAEPERPLEDRPLGLLFALALVAVLAARAALDVLAGT